MLCVTTAATFMLTSLKFCCCWPPKLYLKPYNSSPFSLFLSRVVIGWSHFSPSKLMSKTKTAFEIWETVSITISPSILNSLFSQIPSVLCWTWGNLCLSRFWTSSAIPYLVFYNDLQLKYGSISGLKFAFWGHLYPVQIFTALTALKFMLVKAPLWGAYVLTDPKVSVVLGLSFWMPTCKLHEIAARGTLWELMAPPRLLAWIHYIPFCISKIFMNFY